MRQQLQTPGQKLVAVRDQFVLKGLSDDALKKILPAYRQLISNLSAQLDPSVFPQLSAHRQFWLQSQIATIEAQFAQLGLTIKDVLTTQQLEAWKRGVENAIDYVKAGSNPTPAAAQQTLTSTTIGGQQVSMTGNLPGLAVDSDPAFITPSNPTGGFIRPSITRQQIVAAQGDAGFMKLTTSVRVKGKLVEQSWSIDKLISSAMNKSASDLTDQLRAGFLGGEANDEIARRVSHFFGQLSGSDRGKVWAMTQAVVRTSMAEASQAAHDAFYEANEDLLIPTKSGYRFWWDASNDTRLCPECAPMDGVKYKERDDVKGWPRHFSCRCKILPITATMELLEEEEGPAKGSFLEATPVEKDSNGKRKPPPAGYTGDNAYKRPMKIDGKQQWVRRRDLGPGQTTAGDMLQNANEHSKRMVLGKHMEAFNKLTGKGGQYEKDPQGAVRKLLGNGLPPGSTPPRPTRGPAPKPPAPTPPPAPKPELTQAQILRQRGDQLIKEVAPAINANESIRRRAQTVLKLRTDALVAAKTEAEKEAAKAAYMKAGAILNRSDFKAKKAMDKLFEAMKQTSMTEKEVKAMVDRIDLKQWGTKRDLKKQVKSDVADFVRMFNGKGFTATTNGHPWIQEIAPDLNGRGYNQGGKFLAVRVQNTGNLWHEMMHTVESQRPWMIEAAQEWAANRADDLTTASKFLKLRGMESGTRRGKPVFRLADIVSGSDYSNQEIAWNDDYLNPYMGKVYDSNDATEVWTMAVETISSGRAGMVQLFSKHPDLFRMLVGLSQTP